MSSQQLASQVQTLKKYTACDIADALVKLKVPNAGFVSDLHIYSPGSDDEANITIAPASTVLFTAKSGGDESLLPASNVPAGQHWVDLTEQGTVVVLAQPAGQKCAVLGGIMALRMKMLHAQGIVVHGRVRDITELKDTGLRIWAKAASIVGSGLEAKVHAIQVPLDLEGTVVNPGDLVFSDTTNGVVVIPQQQVTAVLDLLPNLVAADDRVKEEVAAGSSVYEAFQKHRSH